MRSLLLTLLIGLILLSSACGAAAQSTPTPAPVEVTLTTNPNPPAMGPVEMVFTVLDPQGQPVENANVNVIASHTEMSGMNMQGPATHQSGGRYAITANYSMSGEWLVTVEIETEDLDYRQDIDLQIQ